MDTIVSPLLIINITNILGGQETELWGGGGVGGNPRAPPF